jgi:diaminopimelate epimerase
VDTGDPHLVLEVDLAYLRHVDLDAVARPLRHWTKVSPAGANVHLVAAAPEGWWIRSFERGVEGETLACGSGCISAAVALAPRQARPAELLFHTRSGDVLAITLGADVWRLRGPAVTAFTGVARWEPDE